MDMKKISLDNKYIRLFFMSLVIILALIFVQDFAEFLDENSGKVVKLGVNQQCNPFRSICSASIINEGEFQRISFSIQKEVTSANKFLIKVGAIGFDFEGIDALNITFEQAEKMEENINVVLIADKSSHQIVPENWFANVTLAVATTRQSGWLAIVQLKSSKKEYRAEFPCTF